MTTDKWVDSFTHLKSQPRAERALEMLQKVAVLVKPIMRKHNWRLPVLAEFFPNNPNLLGMNVNMGRKILLRLRSAHANDTFLEEDEITQTMLHELTHNVHGPHDDKFYKFLSGLQDEYEALQRSGYAGEGFFSKGHRLGTNVSHNVAPHIARGKASEAAEKRRKTAQFLGSGGKLGGRLETKNLSPRELAARAAERRARDEKICGGGAAADEEAKRAAQDSVEIKVIDLTLDEPEEDVIIVGKQLLAKAGPSKEATVVPVAKPISKPPRSSSNLNPGPSKIRSAPYTKPSRPRMSDVSFHWSCPLCTLLNDEVKLQCEACGSVKPVGEAGWTCLTCGESGISKDFWSCTFCGTVKTSS